MGSNKPTHNVEDGFVLFFTSQMVDSESELINV